MGVDDAIVGVFSICAVYGATILLVHMWLLGFLPDGVHIGSGPRISSLMHIVENLLAIQIGIVLNIVLRLPGRKWYSR